MLFFSRSAIFFCFCRSFMVHVFLLSRLSDLKNCCVELTKYIFSPIDAIAVKVRGLKEN